MLGKLHYRKFEITEILKHYKANAKKFEELHPWYIHLRCLRP
jgi:hypothetical protein